jgi:hypothetical protein
MELLIPDYSLIAWSAFVVITLLLVTYAFIKLIRNDNLTGSARLQWALVILLVPMLGAILYLRANKPGKSKIVM